MTWNAASTWRSNHAPIGQEDVFSLAIWLKLSVGLGLQHLKLERAHIVSHDAREAVYRLGPVCIRRHWRRPSMYGDPIPPGSWEVRAPNGVLRSCGRAPLELAAFLRSLPVWAAPQDVAFQREIAAQFSPNASRQETTLEVARRLGMDAENPTIRLDPARPGWSQAEFASKSSPGIDLFADHPHTPWPGKNIGWPPFVGVPHTVYCLRDEWGRLQQLIAEWTVESTGSRRQPLTLSFTLCQKDDDPPDQAWCVLRTSKRVCPFNLDQALRHSAAAVVVADDLALANRLNERLCPESGAPAAVAVAWPKAVAGTRPEHTNWRVLAGRDALVLTWRSEEGVRDAFDVHDELLTAGVSRVTFRLLEPSSAQSVWDPGSWLPTRTIGVDELRDIAVAEFGMHHADGEPRVDAWRFGDPLPRVSSEYLLDGLVMPGQVVLLYGPAGVGKTQFATVLSTLVAGGLALLGDRLRAPLPRRVLFIGTEMELAIAHRFEAVWASIGTIDVTPPISLYPPPGGGPAEFNLMSDEAWRALDPLVEEADLVVIDHLTNATNGRNDEPRWRQIKGRLEPLKRRGKAVLLLHHAGKDGKQRGTSQIEADVDVVLRLEALPDARNGVRVMFEKHRDDATYGKSMAPFRLYWERDEKSGRSRWWTGLEEDEKPKPWVACPIPAESRLDETALAGFENRSGVILRCLAERHLRGRPGAAISEIAETLQMSESTARSELKTLESAGMVLKEGKGRGTRYRLSETAVKEFILR
ncbi:hypothetical protein FH063_006697 [Azospirillum argentinense]|uniref:AAA+ ATPase domain-containing protein n=2 Tax=Azospirillum argentinense TaxID=2970906 RepID=A0A5B0KR64_9PROT|nr:hypothetical protein FH063_006697 [Azospirillum argentinense]